MTTASDIGSPDCISHILPKGVITDLANQFMRISKVGCGFFNRQGRVLEIVNPDQDFCDLACGNPEIDSFCAGTKKNLAILHEKEVNDPDHEQSDITTHACFLGFSYCVKSIIIDTETVGYISLGPYLTPRFQLPQQRFIEKMPDFTPEQLLSFYADLKKISDKEAADLLLSFDGMVSVIAHSSYKLVLAGQMQFMSMEENYRNLLDNNRELQETKSRLEELDRLKSNLLSTISHELRTPLTSIIGYSDMLLGQVGGGLTKDQEKFVRTINEKGGALMDMINKILDVASIESGRFEMTSEQVPVGELIGPAVEKSKASSFRQDVKVEYIASGEQLSAICDPDSIGRALFHIIDNAVKFSPPGGSVRIQARKYNPESKDKGTKGLVIMAPTLKSIEIMIKDNGPGIPDVVKDSIFDPFYQADDSVTRKYGGLGLGLALVKQYVWANKGSISVESQEDRGTTFFIRLPTAE